MRIFTIAMIITGLIFFIITSILSLFFEVSMVNFFSLLLLAVCFMIAITMIAYWFVILPIRHLNRDLMDIGISGLLSGRVGTGGKDEIGDLAVSINRMLDHLEKAVEQRSATEQRLSRLIALAEEGICLIGPEHKIWFANPKVASIFGTTPAKLLGNSFHNLVGVDDSIVSQDLLQTSEPVRKEYITRRLDGRELYLAVAVAPYPLETGQEGYLCVVSDITGFKETEKALLLSNKKIGLLGSMTRHDIINQLITIRGVLELLHEDIAGDKHLKMIESAQEASARINKYIEFSSEYQMAGIKEPEWQDLNDSVQTALSMLKAGFSYKYSGDDFEIYADRLLMRVFYNLIDNSQKHGGSVNNISVTTEVTENGLLITYEDNGFGIPDNLKGRIFERGVGSGTGWGLFLVSEVLTLTGIQIRETGGYGHGARFEITVPDGNFRRKNKSGSLIP